MEEWRSWSSEPPQIPWAPIMVRLCGFEFLCAHYKGVPPPACTTWKPSGIYREEFHQVTGEWV